MSLGRLALLLTAFCPALLGAWPAAAANLKIYPVRLTLSAKAPIATMTLHNAGDQPALLQMKVFAWSQKDGQDVLEPTRAVLANPAAFELAPGADQIARFGLQSADPSREQSYRVLVQEVPPQAPGKPGEVITLLRVSIPIFTAVARPQDHVVWKVTPLPEGKAQIDVANQGDQHVQLTEVRLTRAGGGQELVREKLSAYVLPGASQRLVVRCASPIRPKEALELRAATDQADMQASVVSAAGPDERALQ
jgi:fimbrial chaperone protein